MPDLNAIRAFIEPHHSELVERLVEFTTRAIAPLPHPHNDPNARIQARQILTLLGEEEWLAPILEQDLRACALIRECLGAASPLADDVFALQALGGMPMLLAGSDAVKARWIDGLIAGKYMAAFAMTEPDAGSDVASMQTCAVRDGNDYIINGTKTLISNAGIADVYTVFASTDPSRGSRGISCFAIPADTSGLRFVKAQVMSAPHPLGEIAFEDCRVPKAWRLGDEGRGFKVGMASLDRLRPTVAAAACGMAERALDEATRYALERHQFGKPIAEFQLIQYKLARMALDLTAARLLVYRATWEKDVGGKERISLEAAMAKAFATEAAQRIIDDAVQIFGGRGVLMDNPVDLLYRSIRALRIYEGTTEIQHLIIASHVLKAAKAGQEG